jgi:hypothetical protein
MEIPDIPAQSDNLRDVFMISRKFGMGVSRLSLFVKYDTDSADACSTFLLVTARDSPDLEWIPATLSDPSGGDDTTYLSIIPCDLDKQWVIPFDHVTDKWKISQIDSHRTEIIDQLRTRRFFWARDELVPGGAP